MYLQKFKVSGAGAFPIDMLRYDSAFPLYEKEIVVKGIGKGKRQVFVDDTEALAAGLLAKHQGCSVVIVEKVVRNIYRAMSTKTPWIYRGRDCIGEEDAAVVSVLLSHTRGGERCRPYEGKSYDQRKYMWVLLPGERVEHHYSY